MATLLDRLKIVIGQWLTIPISRDKGLYNIHYDNVVENKAHFVLKVSLYNSVRGRFPLLSTTPLEVGFLSYFRT